MGEKVVILGGGVAGMTAAHQLVKAKDDGKGDFEVIVLEYRDTPGGKARSMPVPDSAKDNRPPLPAEHGFRFFPGFYRYLPKTLGEIPCNRPGCPQEHVVADHLKNATGMQVARLNDRPASFNFDTPGPFDLVTSLRFIIDYQRKLHIPAFPFGYFMYKLAKLMARRDEWFTKFEDDGWYDYSGASTRFKDNQTYQRYLATGVTRTMVAARANEISARTAGCTMVKMIDSLSRADDKADRVLDGPTNDVWIEPWRRYLVGKGVDYRLEHEVTKIDLQGGKVKSVQVKRQNGSESIAGDHFIAALPVEVMKKLVSAEMASADPILGTLDKLETRWMNGVMVYLRQPLAKQVKGHSIYIDSPWALTSICQQQFWQPSLASMGDGQVRDILSVDVSDWDQGKSNGKIAKDASRSEIEQEVIAQLRAHLEKDPQQTLDAANIHSCFIDPDITFENPRTDREAANAEPLLVNTPKSWQFRPSASTQIANLFLASDYVRCDIDLATMEGANESAHMAVNEILGKLGEEPDDMFPPWRPPLIGGVPVRLPFFALEPGVERVPPDLEANFSGHPGARIADRILVEAASPDGLARDEDWMPTDRELELFGEALDKRPEDTLAGFEHELQHPSAELADDLGLT